MTFKGKTVLITGASRGIGLEIARRLARDGANIVVLAKTVQAQPNLPGTIYTAAKDIEAAGGRALPIQCDVRDEAQIERAVAQAVGTFGGIDACINNASAINLARTLDLQPKRYDLMYDINARGCFFVTQACIPHLQRAANPHVLNMAPPPDLVPRWFAPYPAYAASKYLMSIYALAMAEEFRPDGIAVNTLWPRSFIATSAVKNVVGGEDAYRRSRKPEIMADAAYDILSSDSRETTGRHFLDEEVLIAAGVTDLRQYRSVPGDDELEMDLFVREDYRVPEGIQI